MENVSWRYFKVGVVPVKVEFNEYGARAAYVWENGAFKIDNSFLREVMNGEEVEELTEVAFKKLL